jgi:hypothetical protein
LESWQAVQNERGMPFLATPSYGISTFFDGDFTFTQPPDPDKIKLSKKKEVHY